MYLILMTTRLEQVDIWKLLYSLFFNSSVPLTMLLNPTVAKPFLFHFFLSKFPLSAIRRLSHFFFYFNRVSTYKYCLKLSSV